MSGASSGRLVIVGADLLGQQRADLVVENGLITQVRTGGGSATRPGDEIIDADGLVGLPGLVDPHTHVREPGREDTETIASGARAAAAGGYTAIMAMANTTPVTDTATAAEWVYDRGLRAPHCHVQPVGAVTKGLAGAELAELGLMAHSRARVRMFSDDGKCVHDPLLMRRALEYVTAFDGVVAQHSQDPRLAPPTACCDEGPLSGRLGLPGWPAVAEESIIARDIMLAKAAGARLHVCHLSTAGSVELIRWGKAQGVAVTAEATPHHLALTSDLLASYDSVYKVNPPLRSHADVEAVRAGLADGTIDVVGTDHAPHGIVDKQHDFAVAAFGMLGLETALSVVADTMVSSGQMSWADVAEAMSYRPARLARLAGQGRPLAVGEPANITLIDPQRRITIDAQASQSLSRNNPWHGRTFTGAVVSTIFAGRPTYLDGVVTDVEPDPARSAPAAAQGGAW